MREHFAFYLIMTALFFISLVWGAVNGGSYLPEHMIENLHTTIQILITQLPLEKLDSRVEMTQAFFSYLKFLLLCFGLGISILGFPGLLFLAAYRGYLFGATMSVMIAEHGWTGFILFFLTVFPANFIAIPMILLATAWSANFSLSVLLGRWEGQSILHKVVLFAGSFFILLFFALGAAMVQGFAVPYLVDLYLKIIA